MAFKIIACRTVGEELKGLVSDDHEMVILEFGLHDRPEELQKRLQEEINKIRNSDAILLGYGLCSKGVLGLSSSKAKLVVPRTHDCIGIFLGSMDKYHEEHRREPGTYYLTKGWIKHGGDPLKEFLKWREKYGDEKAFRLIRKTMENYTRLVFIKTGKANQREEISYAKKVAKKFGLMFQLITGSNNILKKMIKGLWDKDFIVIEPGEKVILKKFIDI